MKKTSLEPSWFPLQKFIFEKMAFLWTKWHYARLQLAFCGEKVIPWSFAMQLLGVVPPPEADEGTGKALPISLSFSLEKAAV